MKIIKNMLFSLFALFFLNQISFASNHNEPLKWKFDNDQISTLSKVESKCRQKNISKKVCAAIVWHESSAGKNKINSQSVGNFHNLIKTVYNREMYWKKIKDSRYSGIRTKSDVRNKLLASLDFEVKHATEQLKECTVYLKKINKLNERNMFACYNGGYGYYNSKQAQFYAKNVINKRAHLLRNGL